VEIIHLFSEDAHGEPIEGESGHKESYNKAYRASILVGDTTTIREYDGTKSHN